jgi:hypothetical protein
VGVDYPLNLGPQAVNQQMHANLAGYGPVARNFAALQVHNYQVVRIQHALAPAGGGGQNPIAFEPYSQIAISRGDVLPLVQHPAQPNDLFPTLSFSFHPRMC